MTSKVVRGRPPQVVWLASYPRSGNTLLRTVLYQCFGLRSASVYPNDFGGNKELESYLGHIEHDANGKVRFPGDAIPLIKTHETPRDQAAAVYIVRDGRAACVSLWDFYGRQLPLEAVITGKHRFGTWANHLSAWGPWERPDTLLVKYEEILCDFPIFLQKISQFLNREIINHKISERDTVSNLDGRWVRKKTDWRKSMTDEQLELFYKVNKSMMKKMNFELN